ncbi:hypothetical protein NFI96_026656 [Prochilodus magdalenae]|nr:hypothetical protein NFI96_026656 [Prochilodus magdalenae]
MVLKCEFYLLSVLQEQRLRFLKLQEQQASEQEKLRLLRENAENQEAKLRRVRALKGQVEQKRLSNSKLVEEIEQMNGMFQQKQRELVMAVSRVEDSWSRTAWRMLASQGSLARGLWAQLQAGEDSEFRLPSTRNCRGHFHLETST